MNTNEPGIPNRVEPSAPSPHAHGSLGAPEQSDSVVHWAFIIALAAILAWKYYLYFQSPAMEHGMSAARMGASCSHLLLWVFSYALCISGSRRVLLGILAGVTLFVGVFTLPILGWVGIVVMYFVYRSAPRVSRVAAADAPSDSR